MAVVTRRYISALDPNALTQVVNSGAVPTGLSGAWIQIQYDDALDGITETLDEYMLTLGFLQDGDAGKHLNIRSGDGTVWGLSVTDGGAVEVTGGVAPAAVLSWLATAMVTSGRFMNAWAGVTAEQATEVAATKILAPGTTGSTNTRKARRARVLIDVAPGTGESVTFTLRKNGVDTSLVVVISDANTSGENTDPLDPTNQINVDPGDFLTVRMNKSVGADLLSPGGSLFTMELL